jgi:hypothetical protein
VALKRKIHLQNCNIRGEKLYTIMKELQRETDKRRTPWTDALVVYTMCKNDDKN